MQVSTALAGIIVLIIVAMWLFRRFGFARGTFKANQAQLTVKASCSLGTKERVVVVEIEQEWLVLGLRHRRLICYTPYLFLIMPRRKRLYHLLHRYLFNYYKKR